jgi:hypothetical protein
VFEVVENCSRALLQNLGLISRISYSKEKLAELKAKREAFQADVH